jgi:hypothetical protein
MNELLNRFLELAEDNEATLSVETLMTEDEKLEWETLVTAFDSIDIMNVGKDLKKIQKTYQLERWQEMSILAYVKILEMMIRRAKEAGAMDLMDKPTKKIPKQTEYDGSMFG